MDFIPKRLKQAREYFLILEKSLRIDWHEFYSSAIEHTNWVYRLAAIHPRHYRDYVEHNVRDCIIRGPRGMVIDGGAREQGCQCRLIWGYDCVLTQQGLEADHLFPYSFGGPSIGQNKVFLCTLHNQAKGSDMHLFPWEQGEPTWLPEHLERIRRQLTRPV
jgi:hypothetical protein